MLDIFDGILTLLSSRIYLLSHSGFQRKRVAAQQ